MNVAGAALGLAMIGRGSSIEVREITLLVWLICHSFPEPPLEAPQQSAFEIGCKLENQSFQLIDERDEKGGKRKFAAGAKSKGGSKKAATQSINQFFCLSNAAKVGGEPKIPDAAQ